MTNPGSATPVLGAAAHRLRRAVSACLWDLPERDPVVVACSGGPDSLTLAAVAAHCGRPVSAVVVDHGLQADSASVARSVVGALAGLGIEAEHACVDVAGASGGPEAAARVARYAALTTAAEQRGAACVLLGHTRDDQAESVLLGLARGSGTRSLAGMPAVRGVFRRPFLSIPRSAVTEAAAELGLHPWSDPHNEDPRFARVRVRTRVLPVLEAELGPGIAEALSRTATLARADADALDALADEALPGIVACNWSVAALLDLPRALRTRVIRRHLLRLGAPGDDLTMGHVDEVDRLLTDWHGQGPIPVPGRITVARSYDRLNIEASGQ